MTVMPAAIIKKLQANAAEIRDCSVALQDVEDWDSPAALAILEQLDALADNQARLSGCRTTKSL